MKLVRDRFCASVHGLNRLVGLCLIAAVMVTQIAHGGEITLTDEAVHFSVVSSTVVTNVTHDGEAGKSPHNCPVGFSCHAPALLVSVEFGLPQVAVAAQIISTKSKIYPSQFVNVPRPPPLSLRV